MNSPLQRALRIRGFKRYQGSSIGENAGSPHSTPTATASGLHSRSQSSEHGNRLKVAFIGGRGVGSAYSGIERYYEEIGGRLAARGHKMLVYCRSHFSPRVRSYRGMRLRRIPTIRSKHLETLIHSFLATVDVCFRDIDVVQFHALGSSVFAWLPRLAGKKTVVSVRGLDWQRAKWGLLARAYLRFCESASLYCPNATVVVSRTLQRYFRNRFGAEVQCIRNGVGRPEHLPPEEIRRWGLAGRDYVLYAGRISPEKGLDCLIEAHRAIESVCALVIAGGSSYSEEYIARLKSRAGPRVIFTGYASGRSLGELYSNALAFVLPSRIEGLSVALLEAVAYGLPVVVSDIPENREVVEECGGRLFRLDDVNELREVLQKVVNERSAISHTGSLAREGSTHSFDWDQITLETERFYLKLLDRHHTTSGQEASGAGIG